MRVLDVCVLSLKATLHFLTVLVTNHYLKLGSHFERAALTIITARLCVLIRGARDTFAVVALQPGVFSGPVLFPPHITGGC